MERFRREATRGRVVAFPSHDRMFITDQERVLRETLGFLLGRSTHGQGRQANGAISTGPR